ncbi:MAG: hypothetical protein L6R43_02150 [Planctomycetes bacterium]|nr:hypothetical protein [Planctomycetota bacterium]
MKGAGIAAALLCAAAALAAGGAPRLGPPVKVLDGKEPIDVEVGHATPNLLDWDGDGKRDLLVGQFGGGRLRFYRNVGRDDAPAFEGFAYVQAGGKDATVPVS